MTTTNEWRACAIEDVATLTDAPSHTTATNECPRCHIELVKRWNEYSAVCPSCAACVPVAADYGANEAASYHAKPAGIKTRLYQQTLSRCTANPEEARRAQNMRTLRQYNFINTAFTLPQDVLDRACDMAANLDCVRRGRTRRGMLGACVYEQCRLAHITKTKTQIAHMMQVEEAKISLGLAELLQQSHVGTVELPANRDPTADNIDTYFEVLGLPTRYRDFAVDLAVRMAAKNIPEVMQCFNTTKAIGVVYFVARHTGTPVSHEQVSSQCEHISRGTYMNVVNAIVANERKLRKTFVRHAVVFPAGWTVR